MDVKDNSWTLFLDRDGVINQRLMDNYVKSWSEFEFLPGVLKALNILSEFFGTIIVVTNQQGIGKGLMSEKDLEAIHHNMLDEIEEAGGRIDDIIYCPDLASKKSNCRKPNPTMAHIAKNLHPAIDFRKSVMVGDTESDILFGKSVDMKTVFIGNTDRYEKLRVSPNNCYAHLLAFSEKANKLFH